MDYSTIYKYGLSKLPDRLIEYSGGSFYNIMGKLFPQKHSQNMYIEKLDTYISYPWGLASGWADSYIKMLSIKKLGAGIVFGKTITFLPKKGNPYPRLVRDPKKKWLINSMGLPNYGLIQWIRWLKKNGKLPFGCFLSVKGDTGYEWKVMINSLSQYTDLIELNVSCPNVSIGILDKDKTIRLIKSILRSTKNTNISLKISSEYSTDQILDLLKSLDIENDNISGISLFNTYPIEHQRLGNKQKIGGLSGPILYPKLLKTVKLIRESYSYNDLLIFAMGGIDDIQKIKNLWDNFRAFPLILTAFLTEGPFIFKNFIDKGLGE
ncbi:MAG: Dihydroorotate dehydrogenase B (NAD(+)), catalytic subunit [Candidatus Heimdallarchaeota archaeon LC_3]|nr:MAG: Dihydroorotate dehydrogenase B (NAD(+)), catalytic subunit [Candidatus Heimdallarchaeota archaeon LC_3]